MVWGKLILLAQMGSGGWTNHRHTRTNHSFADDPDGMTDVSQFRTTFPMPDYPEQIGPDDRLLIMGSCFSDHIGAKLQSCSFDTTINPAGVLFNPISICQTIDRICLGADLPEQVLVRQDSLWHSLYHHSVYSAPSKEALLQRIADADQDFKDRMRDASWLLLTLGSAHVQVDRETGVPVANCHKLPAARFQRRLLALAEVVEHLSRSLAHVHRINPALRVVFTVSPVRYWKDGAIDNLRSKSTLILAVHDLVDDRPHAHYFPAYELVIDDLRDYRFFDRDMLHPSPQAIEYVWTKFSGALLDQASQEKCRELERLNRSLEHRPLHPESDAHRRFVDKLAAELQDLRAKYPSADFAYQRRQLQVLLDDLD